MIEMETPIQKIFAICSKIENMKEIIIGKVKNGYLIKFLCSLRFLNNLEVISEFLKFLKSCTVKYSKITSLMSFLKILKF